MTASAGFAETCFNVAEAQLLATFRRRLFFILENVKLTDISA